MSFINFEQLSNPIFYYKNWSVKDACMVYNNGVFFLFFSAFYRDKWKIRSHVVEVSTNDWIHFSKPIFNIDGKKEGWTGLCSPNISLVGKKYILTFNSWGDRHKNGRTNNLFYMESLNLREWTDMKQIAKNLTENSRVIDIAITYTNNKYYAIWKERFKGLGDKTRIAISSDINDDFEFIEDGFCEFKLKNGEYSTKIQENYEFLHIDNRWYLLTTDYSPHKAMFYEIDGDGNGKNDTDWLVWKNGVELKVPKENFNTNHIANAAFLADWRNFDGYVYLLYAGRTEGISHAGRGNNKLGLSRSRNVKGPFETSKNSTIQI